MLSKVLLTSAVIGLATAQVPAIAKRDFLENRQLDQLDGLDPKCASAISEVSTLYSSVPTPPADLLSVTLPSDPCVTPTFTGKLQSEWATYTSEALDWFTSHSDELMSFVTACSGIVNAGAVPTDIPVCSSAASGITSSPATTTPAPTGSGSPSSSSAGADGAAASSGSPSSAVPTPNAAPRETGYLVAAAAAAAGLMGVVAAL
ncbi:hypothetical protein F5Y14DRAFT_458072 [Nemania sp. NC0429]|nr:hypothetical protein F5Y14DRAFT_458072 [Nemania sp. NC0429]